MGSLKVWRQNRREFLQVGLTAVAGLSLPNLYRLQAETNRPATPERTAVILVWLRGGMSHLDTYDPKPDAPSEYRGPFGPIDTRAPGLRITELLPRHAAIADKFNLLRSMRSEEHTSELQSPCNLVCRLL